MSNDTDSPTLVRTGKSMMQSDVRLRFNRAECVPVTEHARSAIECLQCVYRTTERDETVRATFLEHPQADVTFSITVGADPFDEEYVYFEQMNISSRCSMTKEALAKRAATLAFVARLAVSIRPTAGDRNA